MKPINHEIFQSRPALFDWMVFIISFSLGFIFPKPGEFIVSAEFSWWMLIVLLIYVTGTWLKHLPLSHRLQSAARRKEIWYMIFLLSGHWCIIMVVMIFAEEAFLQMIGMQSLVKKNPASSTFVFSVMFLSGFITWMVYRPKRLPKNYKSKPDNYLARRELFADILLVISVSVFTFVIWEKGVLSLLGYKAVGSFSEVFFLFLMLCITYLLLYLPLRYLFLIEDMTSRQTWKRLLLIFAFLLLRSLFEILSI